ncbi:hypothetical protein [Nocardia vulneris]|uniref:Uncharacterized protein n=1 Tax=Nocardia vulneris TaxID=1141657 RepID=A0ABR4ZKF7_9NOCA|nr:hypothetical protein [Nocardia vulneris]KIA65902.1 hypothetical protein FG87_05465 [Nocardia vulneris]
MHRSDISERKFFAEVAKRPGMYVGRVTVEAVSNFLLGYDQGAVRHGGRGLSEWRDWLIANYPVAPNLGWSSQVRQIALTTEEYEATRATARTADQDARAVRVLFDLLDRYLAEREGAQPGTE